MNFIRQPDESYRREKIPSDFPSISGTPFGGRSLHDGNLGNRASADSLCATAASAIPAVNSKTYKKAFPNYSSADQIKDLVPSPGDTLPVYGIKADGTATLSRDA